MLIGIFFLTAAWQVNSSESSGLGKALQMHQEQPYGPWVLGIVAVGLFAFGIYSVIEGAYRLSALVSDRYRHVNWVAAITLPQGYGRRCPSLVGSPWGSSNA